MKNISTKTNVELQKIMLFIAIIFMPFVVFPKRFTISFIGNNIIYYPIIIGLLLWSYEWYNTRKINFNIKYLYFFSLITFWQILCTFIGVFTFDYYNLIDLNQMDKLRLIVQWLTNQGVLVDTRITIKIWLLFRFVKDIINYNFIFFGTSLWICHLYNKNWSDGFRNIRKAVLFLVSVICCYSIVELFYLKGSATATKILTLINPFIFDVQSAHGWWPPLLWNNQLRSIFPEPSYFGIMSTMIVPLFVSYFLENNKIISSLFYMFYIFLLYITKARTAILLFIGELIILFFVSLMYIKDYFRKVTYVIFCSIMAFFMAIIFFQNVNTDKNIIPRNIVNKYVENNIASAVGNKRSNSARLSNLSATINVGIQHPIFGVGNGFTAMYINNNIPEWSYKNEEVRNWSRYLRMEGILKSDLPILNEFAIMFARYGIIGILLYLFPIIYVMKKLFCKNYLQNNFNLICVLVAFMGSVIAMFSNAAFLNFYILLGLLLCRIDDSSDNKNI